MNKRYITIFFGIVISLVMAVADTGKLYTSDKLSSSLLTSVCQDSYGYIWVGSEYGLNKFDGYSFTLYHTTQGDTTSIVNNNISTLYPSSNGFLWVGMSKGLCRYDYHNNNFVRYVFPEGLRPRVNAIAERNGDLLIGTAGYGLFSIRKGTKKIINDMIGFATADGITVFYPSDVNKIGSKLGEVFLTGMTIAGVTADCLASEWTIPYGESTFKNSIVA